MNISISASQVEETRHRGERTAQGLNSGSDSVPPPTATGTASPHRKGRHFPPNPADPGERTTLYLLQFLSPES